MPLRTAAFAPNSAFPTGEVAISARVATGALALCSLVMATLAHGGAAHAQAEAPPRRGVLASSLATPISRGPLEALYRTSVAEPFALEGLVLAVDNCGPDPEAYLDEALLGYALSPRPGEMVDDALVWQICREQEIARFYFSVDNPYAGYLDPASVEADMAEALATGDVEAAARAGLQATAKQLELAPPRATPTPPGWSAEAPGRTFGEGWEGFVLLSLLAAALGALLWWGRRSRRPTRLLRDEDAPEALRRLRATADSLAPRILGEPPDLTRLIQACEPLGDRLCAQLDRRHEAMARRLADLQDEIEALESRALFGAAPDALAGSRAQLERLLVESEAISGYAERLLREARHAGELHMRAEELVPAARAELDSARAAYERATAALVGEPDLALPDSARAFRFTEARLVSARQALLDGRRLEAARRAEDAVDLAVRTARSASAAARAARSLEQVRESFERTSSFPREDWRDIRANGSEAEESLVLAVRLLDALFRADEAELGPDPAAGFAVNLSRAGEEIDRAMNLVEAIDARLTHLEAVAKARADQAAEPVDAAAAGRGDVGAVLRAEAAAAVDRGARFSALHPEDSGRRAISRVADARAELERAIAAESAAGERAAPATRRQIDAGFRLARAIADEAWRMLAEAFQRAERAREPELPRRAWARQPAVVSAEVRESPFPARYGSWGEPREGTRSARARKGCWGSRPRGAQVPAEGW